VLDGQQRLTSLYQAFFGCGEYIFYLDINLYLEGKDLADGEVIKFQKAKKKVGTKSFREVMESDISYQAENRVMPLSVIFGPGKNFNKALKSNGQSWSRFCIKNREIYVSGCELRVEYSNRRTVYDF
jgi:hypothetical protein